METRVARRKSGGRHGRHERTLVGDGPQRPAQGKKGPHRQLRRRTMPPYEPPKPMVGASSAFLSFLKARSSVAKSAMACSVVSQFMQPSVPGGKGLETP